VTGLEFASGLGLGALVREGVRWLHQRRIARRVREESAEGPEFGTPGWLWREIVRERGARHALARDVADLRDRLARLEGASGAWTAAAAEDGPSSQGSTGVRARGRGGQRGAGTS